MLLQEKFFNAILSESFCENSIPDTVAVQLGILDHWAEFNHFCNSVVLFWVDI